MIVVILQHAACVLLKGFRVLGFRLVVEGPVVRTQCAACLNGVWGESDHGHIPRRHMRVTQGMHCTTASAGVTPRSLHDCAPARVSHEHCCSGSNVVYLEW